jgi:hypothetical protein
MLVATRDPLQHPLPRDEPRLRSRIGRMMGALQLIGTVLGIPVGLASAYSIYHANFSVDVSCQNLRVNIVSIIDKQIDPTARRMLVRRDVEKFEESCGGFDPDAEAAFKVLLASDAPPSGSASSPAKQQTEPATKSVSSKGEAHTTPEGKQAVSTASVTAGVKNGVATRDTAADARWLEAVRGALTSRSAERSAAAVAPLSRPAEVPRVPEPSRPINQVYPQVYPTSNEKPIAAGAVPVMPPAEAVSGTSAVPTLPPAESVATTAAQPGDADHPLPPRPILKSTSGDKGDAAEKHSWFSQIPFVGTILEQ